MKYEEFITHVQSVSQLDSREEAERATRATLETIKERIVGDEAGELADQLPQELGGYLRGREGENGETFDLQEFIQRVSEKEAVDPIAAANHARSVFTVLQTAVTPGEFEDVRANFSDDYDAMFMTGTSSSEMPAM